MPAQLRFNKATVNATAFDAASFVSGSGSYSPDTSMQQVDTADGKVHQIPHYFGGSASFKVRGMHLARTTPIGLGKAVKLSLDSTDVLDGAGLATASYSESDDSTSFELKIDPTSTGE
jgi:hypothetical protein